MQVRGVLNGGSRNGEPREGRLRLLLPALTVILLLAEGSNGAALGDSGDLGTFHGVWIGTSVIAQERPGAPIVTARDLGFAIQQTETGFAMTWRTLSRKQAPRTRAHFAATSEPDVFAAESIDPPMTMGEVLGARMDSDRLVVFLSRSGGGGAVSLARYELSVSEGRMAFGYTLSRDGEVLESVTGSLTRAKIVF